MLSSLRDRRVEDAPQLREIERLQDVVKGAASPCLVHRVDERIGRYDDYRQAWVLTEESVQDLETGHAGHPEIQADGVGNDARHEVNGGSAVVGLSHFVATRDQHLDECLADIRIIINDKNAPWHAVGACVAHINVGTAVGAS